MPLTDQTEFSSVTIPQVNGATHKVGTPNVTVLGVDVGGNVTKAQGTTVPTDADAGYSKGCMFIKTDGGVATTNYINEGTAASCDFNAIESAASTVTGVTAGNGLTGGGTEGTVTLNVGVAIYNNSGATLTRGTLVNLNTFTGTNGTVIVKADADTNIMATHVLTADLANNTAGSAFPVATVVGTAGQPIDTSGRTIGDAVFLSATAGGFTFSAPTGADQLSQKVGIVKVVSATVGEIVFFPGDAQYKAFGSSFYQAGSILNAAIGAAAAIDFSKLAALTSANILVGSAGNVATSVAVTGDVTISNAGVTAIGAGKVTEAMAVAPSTAGLGFVRFAHARYVFATDGGAIATITPAANATIPINAIILGGTCNVTTQLTSGGAATISIGTSAGSSTTALKADTAVASYTVGQVVLTPVFTGATYLKLTAAGQITITVSTATLTAGVMDIIVLYIVGLA